MAMKQRTEGSSTSNDSSKSPSTTKSSFLLSPSKPSFLLSPFSSRKSLNSGSGNSSSSSSSNTSSSNIDKKKRELKRRLKHVVKSTANKKCCDCHDGRPSWASLVKPGDSSPTDSRTLVSFICYNCASVHRKLGTHVCFVRSITLDQWTESQVESAELSGNTVVNKIYEANWKKLHQDNPAAEISRPVHGSDSVVLERFIRQKYEQQMFYNRQIHCEHNFHVKQPSFLSPTKTPKSPGVRKRLGAFFAQDKARMPSISKLHGSKSISEGGTAQSSPTSDSMSFLSVPIHIRDRKKDKSEKMDTAHQGHHHRRRRHNQQDNSGSSSVSLDYASSMAPRSGESMTTTSDPSWVDTNVPLKHDDECNNDDNDNAEGKRGKNSAILKGCSNHSEQSNGSMLLKKPESHSDPRRAAFHSSRSGSMNLSASDLNISDSDINGSDRNQISMPPTTPKKRPTLISANVVSRPSPHNSRMNLYAHGSSKQLVDRNRGRSQSRTRDGAVNGTTGTTERSRSSSRLRDGRQPRTATGRSRSRGPVAEDLRKRYGRGRSSSRLRDGQDGTKTDRALQRTERRREGRRGRSQSVSKDRDTVADSLQNLNRHGRSSSRIRSSSKGPNTTRGSSRGLNRSRSVSRIRQGKSEDVGNLADKDEPRRERVRGKSRTALERSKSENLNGMVLVLDDSKKNLAFDIEEGEKQRQKSKGEKKRQKSRRGRSADKIKADEHKHSKKRDNRSHSRSRSRGRSSSRSLRNDDGEQGERDRSRSRSHSRGKRDPVEEDEKDRASTSALRRGKRQGQGSSRSLRDSNRSLERPVSQRSSQSSEKDSRLPNKNEVESDQEEDINDIEPRRSRRGDESFRSRSTERNSTRSLRSATDTQSDHSSHRPSSMRSNSSRIVLERSSHHRDSSEERPRQHSTSNDDQMVRTPKLGGSRHGLMAKSKSFRAQNMPSGKEQKGKTTLDSPGNSGENDFQVIAAKPFTLATGSDHSLNDSSTFQRSFQRDVSKDKFMKDTRRCSRERRATLSKERKARKSDIFASLDREESESTSGQGPLMSGLQRGVGRSKSGVGTKLMIRPAPPQRSKSSDMFKSRPGLNLGVELGKGKNNDALMKAWKSRQQANEKELEEFEHSVLR